MKIEWLISGSDPHWIEDNFKDGGYAYDTYSRRVLRDRFELDVTYLPRAVSKNKVRRFWQMGQYLLKARKLKFSADVVVRDPFSTVFSPFDTSKKNVVLLHHVATSSLEHQGAYNYFYRKFFERLKQADLIIVVAQYWKEILQQHGIENTKVIYNSFDTTQFEFDKDDLIDFKCRLGINNDKPTVYLGNARVAKGFLDIYEALSEFDINLVATGRERVDLPIIQSFFSYRDYLRLLKVSDISMAMSTFEEGWNRIAHESMLCGTPVVGTGTGGMGELLSSGGQLICKDPTQAREAVSRLLEDPQELQDRSRKGQQYASQFDLDYFQSTWVETLEALLG